MVGICVLIDISKAYDRTNYIGSFTKLMDQLLPANVLLVIEDCFHESFYLCHCESFSAWLWSFDKAMFYRHTYLQVM